MTRSPPLASRGLLIGACLVGAGAPAACERPAILARRQAEAPAPDRGADFESLYAANCAGCHGADGTLGPARPLRDPHYLATIPTSALREVIERGSPPGTLMPAMGASAGGALRPDAVDAIVKGLVDAWGTVAASDEGASSASDAPAASDAEHCGELAGPSDIPYSIDDARRQGTGTPNAARGEALFAQFCASCHVPSARVAGAIGAGTVTDGFYLRLVSDQALRSAVIFGRRDLGMPGALGPFPGLPAERTLEPQEVTDIVGWLAAQRSANWPPRTERRDGTP